MKKNLTDFRKMVETSVDPCLLQEKGWFFTLKVYENAKFTHHGKQKPWTYYISLFIVKEHTYNNMIRLFTNSKLY